MEVTHRPGAYNRYSSSTLYVTVLLLHLLLASSHARATSLSSYPFSSGHTIGLQQDPTHGHPLSTGPTSGGKISHASGSGGFEGGGGEPGLPSEIEQALIDALENPASMATLTANYPGLGGQLTSQQAACILQYIRDRIWDRDPETMLRQIGLEEQWGNSVVTITRYYHTPTGPYYWFHTQFGRGVSVGPSVEGLAGLGCIRIMAEFADAVCPPQS